MLNWGALRALCRPAFLRSTILASRFSKHTVKFFVADFNKPDLQTLADLMESGRLRPAIDRTYELTEAQDAFRTFGDGHVRGKLVLTI